MPINKTDMCIISFNFHLTNVNFLEDQTNFRNICCYISNKLVCRGISLETSVLKQVIRSADNFLRSADCLHLFKLRIPVYKRETSQ